MLKKILVVDDNPIITRLVSEIIKKQGYSVKCAEDGLSAVNILEEYVPDIIFVDLILPKISGEELCQIIRSKNKFKDTYIIILSGVVVESELNLNKLKVDACIAKGKNIATHISAVLNKIESKILREEKSKVYGFDEIFIREATVELLDSKKHLEVILANLSNGLVEVTSEGIIIFANPAAENLFSTPLAQLLGINFLKFFQGEDYYSAVSMFEKAQLGSHAVYELRHLSLKERFITLNILPLEDTPHPSCIIIMQDITEQKIAETALLKSEEHFRDLIENTTDMVQNVTPDGHILYVNNAWKNTLGYSVKELDDLNVKDIIDPDHLEQCMQTFSDVIHGGTVDQIETTFIAKDGRKVQVLGSASCRYEGDQPVYTRGIFHDLTERKKAEYALQERDIQYRALFENSTDSIMIMDTSGLFVSVNPVTLEMFGLQNEQDIIKQSPAKFSPEFQPDGTRSSEKVLKMIKKGYKKGINDFEWVHKRLSGEEFYTHVRLTPLQLDEQAMVQVAVRDITKQKQLEEELKLLATTDQLTGAYNRRAFEDFFDKESSRAKRYNHPLSLVIFDIDHFKKVNDTYGHDAGDLVLKEIVNLSLKQMRPIDFLCRWGGEEFVLVLPETEIEGSQNVADRLRISVEEWKFSIPSVLTVSLGVSQLHINDSADSLTKRADKALYEAKKGGRNRVVVIPFPEPELPKE